MHVFMDADFSDCRQCACLALRRLSRDVTAHYERAFRGSGLRATQFTVLAMLAQTGPLAMSRVAEMLGLDRTTLNRSVAPLEKRGLVASRRGTDPRVRALRVTPAGHALATELLPRWRKAQNSVASVIARHAVPTLAQTRENADDLRSS